jgi:hypothetical protein
MCPSESSFSRVHSLIICIFTVRKLLAEDHVKISTNLSIFFIRGQWGSNAAGGWFEAGRLLRLAADLDTGAMRVAVANTDGTCAGGENATTMLYP